MTLSRLDSGKGPGPLGQTRGAEGPAAHEGEPGRTEGERASPSALVRVKRSQLQATNADKFSPTPSSFLTMAS